MSIVHALRLRLWALMVAARLRRSGTSFHLDLGPGVRCATRPAVRIRGGGRGGSVTVRLGPHVDLGRNLLIDLGTGGDSELDIGAHTELENAVRLQLLAGRIVIGPSNEIRDGAVLKTSAPDAELRLGERVKVGRNAAVHCHTSVRIDDLATLGERVTVVDSYHDVDGSDRWTMEQPLGTGPVHIGRNALVLSGAVVLHGTTVGRSSVVAANALVRDGEYAPGSVLFGLPARTVRRLPAADGASDG